MTSIKNLLHLKKYSRDEVARHNKREDLWLIVQNKIYDLTKYYKKHPGGEAILIELAGKDATNSFEEVGHSRIAKDLMKSFLIGELKSGDRTRKSVEPNAPLIKLFMIIGTFVAGGIASFIIEKSLLQCKKCKTF